MATRIHKVRYIGIALVVLVLVLTIDTPTWAMEPRPLPSFLVSTLDGVSVLSEELSLSGRWLLVYVRPHCVSCDVLLHLLKKDALNTVPPHLIVIVGGRLEEAKEEIRRFPDLAEASWYTDSFKEAFQQLKLQGVPVVMGMRNGTIEWSISGVMFHADAMNTIVRTWLEMG